MPAFYWNALDGRGRTKKGVTEADSQSALIRELQGQNLNPIEITEGKPKVNKGIDLSGLKFSRKKISAKELFTVTRQLATLIAQGVPVDSALSTIIQQTEKKSSKNLLTAVRAKVVEGHTLAQSLSEFSRVFPDFYVFTVAAGEKTGNLPVVLESLAEYLHASYTSKQKIILALIYPIFIVIVAITIVVALLTWVVPDIVNVFVSSKQELPFITQSLISFSDFLQNYHLELLMVILLVLLGINFVLKTTSGRSRLQGFMLKLPLIGKLMKNNAALKFIRTLSILLKSKVEITDAINISSQVVNVLPIKDRLETVNREVKEGMALSRSLEKTGVFTPIVLSLVASGEKSGSLAEMLKQAAETQEQDLHAAISFLLGVFEPVMILLMGLLVLIIVLAILMPIFDMNTLVR